MHVDETVEAVGFAGLEDDYRAAGFVVGVVEPVAVFEGAGGVGGVFGGVGEVVDGDGEVLFGVEGFGVGVAGREVVEVGGVVCDLGYFRWCSRGWRWLLELVFSTSGCAGILPLARNRE